MPQQQSRQLTADEVRATFLRHVWALVRYWDGKQDALEGLAFSILVMLDGESAELPGFAIIPMPHPDDKAYCISQCQNWIAPFDSSGFCDISGALHEDFITMEEGNSIADGQIRAIINCVCIYAHGGVLYEVAYWQNGERKTAWVNEAELAGDAPRRAIGFDVHIPEPPSPSPPQPSVASRETGDNSFADDALDLDLDIDLDADDELDLDGDEPAAKGKTTTPARLAQLARLKAERAARSRRGSAGVFESEKERRRTRGDTYVPATQELIAELQRQAMGGVMPSQVQFDESKPANWANAISQITRLKCTWDDLRQMAGLKPHPRGIRAR